MTTISVLVPQNSQKLKWSEGRATCLVGTASHWVLNPSGIFQSLFFQVSDLEQSHKSRGNHGLTTSVQTGLSAAWLFQCTWTTVLSRNAGRRSQWLASLPQAGCFRWRQAILEKTILETKHSSFIYVLSVKMWSPRDCMTHSVSVSLHLNVSVTILGQLKDFTGVKVI